MACRLQKQTKSFFLVLLHALATEVLTAQGIGGKGVPVGNCLLKPPGRFPVVLLRAMSIGMAFTDAVSEVSFLLGGLFRPVKGIQCVPEPQLCFLLIFPAALPQQVHSADVITGIAIAPPCFHHQKG